MLESVPSHQLADIMASIVNATFNEKLDILNAVDLKIRFEKALPLLLRQIEGVKLLQEKQELEKREGMLIVAYLLKLAKYVPKIQVSGIFHIFNTVFDYFFELVRTECAAEIGKIIKYTSKNFHT